MEEQRRLLERRARRMGKRKNVQLDIEKVLGISPTWWGEELSDPNFDFDAEDEDEDAEMSDLGSFSDPEEEAA